MNEVPLFLDPTEKLKCESIAKAMSSSNGTGHLKRDRRISDFFIALNWTFQHLSLIS